jgi:hypothetical protein
MINQQVLPLLMQLLIKEGAVVAADASEPKSEPTATPGVTEPVKVELAATVAILLEAKFPHAQVNPFCLLKLPAFVEEMEPLDAASSDDTGVLDADESSASAGQQDDNDMEEKTVVPLSLEYEIQCSKVLCAWLAVPARRVVAAQTLPVLYRAFMETASHGEMSIGKPSGAFPMEDLVQRWACHSGHSESSRF